MRWSARRAPGRGCKSGRCLHLPAVEIPRLRETRGVLPRTEDDGRVRLELPTRYVRVYKRPADRERISTIGRPEGRLVWGLAPEANAVKLPIGHPIEAFVRRSCDRGTEVRVADRRPSHSRTISAQRQTGLLGLVEVGMYAALGHVRSDDEVGTGATEDDLELVRLD